MLRIPRARVRLAMECKYLIFLMIIGFSGISCEENRRPNNPIINLFEAPLKALRTKPGEAVAVFQPQVVKASNGTSSGWYPGQAIGNAASSITSWISQNVPLAGVLTTSTTPEPDVIVQVQTSQGNKKSKKKKQPNLPDLNQLLQGSDDEDDDEEDDEEEDDEGEQTDENEKDDDDNETEVMTRPKRPSSVGNLYRHGFRNGIRSEARYGPPIGNKYKISIRKPPYQQQFVGAQLGPGPQFGSGPQFGPQNQFFDPIDQLYRPPRPPIYHNPMPAYPPKRRRKGYHKRRGSMSSHSKKKRKSQQKLQIFVSPELGDQLPVLIPVQSVAVNKIQKKKKKVKRPLLSDALNGITGVTYIPVPLTQINLDNLGTPVTHSPPATSNIPNIQNLQNIPTFSGGIPTAIQTIGVDGIPVQQIVPQLQIVAQHTHTISPGSQIILGDDFDMGEEPINRPSRPSRPARPARPTKSSRPSRPQISTKKPRPLGSDPWATNTGNKFSPNRRKPVIVRITPEQEESYNSRPDVEQDEDDAFDVGYGNMPNPFISVGDEEEEEEEGAKKNVIQGRSEATSQYYIPQEYFPLLGSDSYLAVSNNGRFLLKTGRDLKIESREDVPVQVTKTNEENISELKKEDAQENEPEKPATVTEVETVPEVLSETKEESTEPRIEEPISEAVGKTTVVSVVPSEAAQEETSSVDKLALRNANLAEMPQVLLKEEGESVKEDVQSDIKSINEGLHEAIASNPKVPAARSNIAPRGNVKYQEYDLS